MKGLLFSIFIMSCLCAIGFIEIKGQQAPQSQRSGDQRTSKQKSQNKNQVKISPLQQPLLQPQKTEQKQNTVAKDTENILEQTFNHYYKPIMFVMGVALLLAAVFCLRWFNKSREETVFDKISKICGKNMMMNLSAMP